MTLQQFKGQSPKDDRKIFSSFFIFMKFNKDKGKEVSKIKIFFSFKSST